MAYEVQDIYETEQANKIFTDREEPRKAFWDKYLQYKENLENGRKNQITILTYYGIGGIGKSTLLHKIQEGLDDYKSRMNKKDVIPYVYYDMKTETSKRAILEGLRRILMKNYGFEFPVFELALNIYLLKIGKSINLEEDNGIVSSNQYIGVATDIAFAGIDLLNTVPLAGPLAAGTFKLIDKLIANQKNKSANRKIELSNLQKDSPEDILKNLQLNFAKDLAENLKAIKYPLVVFLDTYEKFVNELASVGEPLMNDGWLRDIHNGLVTHAPNVIWVIAGREIIKWNQINPEWSDNFEQHLVGDLSQIDTRKFLTESGITDLTVQQQIYEITKGTPVYLDICVNNYFYLNNNNLEISKKSLGDDQKELVKRFMIYTDGNQKDILYILSCLDTWTEEYLIEIATKNFHTASITTIKTIEGLSFIEIIDGVSYRMHQLVKEILFEQCNPDFKRKILSYDSIYNREKLNQIDPTSEDYIRALKKYINSSADQMLYEESINEFYQKIKDTYIKRLVDTFQYDDVCQIYELILQRFQFDSIDKYLVADIYLDYSASLMNAGKYNDMANYAEKALSMYDEIIDADSTQRVDALHNLAKIYYKLGRTKESLEISEKVVELRKRILGDEHLDTIKAMNNLSIRYQAVGRTKEALNISEKVMELFKRILGEEHPDTIRTWYNLSLRYSATGRKKEALEISKKVLELFKRLLGEEHPDTIWAMFSLSIRLSEAGEFREALEISERVVELRKKILGEEHPDTITAMTNLSVDYSGSGRGQEAIEILKKVVELRKRILGEEHPDTIGAMYKLSNNYILLGRNKEAVEISEEVLELRKRISGEEHHDTKIAEMRNEYYKSKMTSII